ncbi:MAG: biphenyl 2,3-dioxygenase [Pseudomonadota bacterium]
MPANGWRCAASLEIATEHVGENHMRQTSRAFAFGLAFWLAAFATAALAAGDLSKQTPIEVTVDLGSPGKHEFTPNKLRFETGKLYKLVLRNASNDPHYFTSHGFSQMIWTRKVQVTQNRDGKTITLAEFKGAIREVEVYPGQSAEWWFVPVAAGRVTDLRCGITASDGRSHADHGMTGEIVIE